MVSVVISYCSLESPFIYEVIAQCKLFADDIIVVSYDKLLNGKVDIELTDLSHLGVQHFIHELNPNQETKYHHNHLRHLGLLETKEDFVLFLDADEIPDGDKMKVYLQSDFSQRHFTSFDCYWYFREPIYVATKTERCGLLARKRVLTDDLALVYSPLERWAYESKGILSFERVKVAQEPIMHHFSWVRTKSQMIDKVKSWAHKTDKDWELLIEQEFQRKFNGRDFIHNYTYTQVENRFNITL